jgi:hypothetical protein
MTRTAQCCCGACELEAEGEPVMNAICHCDSCKRRTGSAFGWSAYFRDAAIVARRGPLTLYEPPRALPGTQRWFCGVCGTTLYWTSGEFMAGHTGVAGGCFVAEPLGAPTITATDAKRCAWVGLPEGWFAAP